MAKFCPNIRENPTISALNVYRTMFPKVNENCETTVNTGDFAIFLVIRLGENLIAITI